jgi:hypothetical protein
MIEKIKKKKKKNYENPERIQWLHIKEGAPDGNSHSSWNEVFKADQKKWDNMKSYK